MRHASVFEFLESRSMLSAAVKATPLPAVAGPSSGNSPSTTPPQFTAVHGSVHTSNGTMQEESDQNIDIDSAIKIAFLSNGHGSIDATHLVRASLLITDLDDMTTLSDTSDVSKVITSGGGDTVDVSLKNLLQPNTHYSIELNGAAVPSNDLIRTVDGTTFADTTFNFTTGSYFAHPSSDFTSAFSTTAQTGAGNHSFTCVTKGPDGDLYASDTQGYIYRYTIANDGTLTLDRTITTVRDNNGGARLITGIAFSPIATASDPLVLYVSHSQYRFGNTPNGSQGDVEKYADNFTGKISTISGANLDSYQDLVVNIPRSVKDHTNNQPVFSPNGRELFFGVAAMNAMGAADSTWGGRVENIYSATIMVLRLGSAPNGINPYLHNNGPVNLLIDGDQDQATGLVAGTTHYNIFKGTNPLRIYADGIRNDYDMVFATNGHLYAGINGSSANGNVPATPSDLSTVPVANRPDKDFQDANGNYVYHVDPKDVHSAYKTYSGPTSPGLTAVPEVEEDTLLDVQITKYYGHPNPARGEYIIDGANPTSGEDPYEFAENSNSTPGQKYPVGQQPDRSYTLPAYDFGQDYSPDGMLQYKSVGGKDLDMDGYLMVARYAFGDVLALKPNATTGKIDTVQARVTGLTGFGTPLDLTEDTSNGNVYVAVLNDETGAAANGGVNGSIQLLKPTTTTVSTVSASVSPSKLGFYVTPGKHSAQKGVTITNTGTAPLVFDPTTSRIGGTGRKNFGFVNFPGGQTSIAVGASLTLQINGRLNKGQTNTAAATLYLATNDPNHAFFSVPLRAFNVNGSSPSSVASNVFASAVSKPAGTTTATASLMDQLGLDA